MVQRGDALDRMGKLNVRTIMTVSERVVVPAIGFEPIRTHNQ